MGTQTQNAPSTALSKLLSDAGLAPEKAGLIVETLAPLVEQAGELCREAQGVTVTDATQVTEMRQAREIRLKLVKVRTGAEAARKVLKADALALGKAIDACGNWIKNQTEPVEARLMECELFAERAEAARKQKLRDERYALLAEVGTVDAAIVSTLGDMKQDAFDAMLQGAKLAKKAREEEAKRQEQARKDEEARRARELEEARAKQAQAEAEAAKLRAERAEQDRLAAEAAERERRAREAIEAKARAEREAAEIKAREEREAIRAKAAAEQAEAERKLRAEREAREKIEREQRERDAAEKKRRDAEARAAKKAAAAPDADKLRAYAKSIGAIKPPTCSTQEGRNAVMRIETALEVVLDSISLAADEIGGGE